MSPNVYSTIEEKGYTDGIAFIMTNNASMIEAHLYGGVIISSKSLRLTPDQVSHALSNGDIKEVSFRKADIKLDEAKPAVIAETFPAAVAASAINTEKTSLQRLSGIVRLMSSLATSSKEDGLKTADSMYGQISMHYRGFLPDVATCRARITRLNDEFGIATHFLSQRPMPGHLYAAMEWLLGSFAAVKENAMRDVALYFILFGEVSNKAIKITVEKSTGLGAKQGFGVLSNAVYGHAKGMRGMHVFKGLEKVGEFKIDWHTDKKDSLLLTKADMDKLSLENGNKVNLILSA